MEHNRAAFLTGSLAIAAGTLARPADAATAPPASATPPIIAKEASAGSARVAGGVYRLKEWSG